MSEDLPDDPKRIVSLAPNITEILFELGVGSRVVGVTRFCDYPAGVDELPHVGGTLDPDLEAIMAQDPDLVIGVMSGADPAIAQRLDFADIPFAFAEMDDLRETYAAMLAIGAWVDKTRRARTMVSEMRDAMGEASPAPEHGAPDVLFVYGRRPLVVAGAGSFGHELVELAGGKNPVTDADSAYPKIDLEKVFELDPDIIIDATMSDAHEPDFWRAHEALSAVRQGRVFRLTDTSLLRPGPRLPHALAQIREAIELKKPESVRP